MARIAGSDGEVTRSEIRKVSLSLFAQFGYAAVSMRQIASQVGVQASAIYQYYPNKQQILVSLLQNHMDGLLSACHEEITAKDPVDRLEQFARFHIRYNINRPDEVFLSYMELRSLEPEGFATIADLRSKYEAVLKSILHDGIKSGVMKIDDPHVSAMAILAMLTGVNTWYRSGGRLSQKKIENMYASMVLKSQGIVPSDHDEKEAAHV
ncbi:MAG: TetR family transcriptional regulator [Rhizobiaceae bacterium]|nr:TetR family transcriptional regulator [Rhizobiaceae bacterium]